MSQKKYTHAVFIGRFQPWHRAHQQIAMEGLKIADKLIIVLGSSNKPRTIENPWTVAERKEYISQSIQDSLVDEKLADRVIFTSISDSLYNNNQWLANVNTAVKNAVDDSAKIVVIGHYKDKGSWWLDKFPQWDLKDMQGVPTLNATDIRKAYFKEKANIEEVFSLVPKATYSYLEQFVSANDILGNNNYVNLVGEMEHVKKYKEPYEKLPYGVKHVTADAVVFCAGHILMIRRRAHPGKGLWALPGGHIEMDEDVNEYAAIRELMEETKLKVPLKVLEGSLKGEKVFGHPKRSLIGRVITHSYMFELDLPPDGKLPKVKGSDDAEKARWVPINEVEEEAMFDDHFSIFSYWQGRTTKK